MTRETTTDAVHEQNAGGSTEKAAPHTAASPNQPQAPKLPKVSPTCERVTEWRTEGPPLRCRRPTAYWYPACRPGSTMALCADCAAPLLTSPAYGLQSVAVTP